VPPQRQGLLPRGLLQISRDRDDWMGLKIKTQKIPRASIKTQKNSSTKNFTRPPPSCPQKIPCRISKPFKFPESIKWHNTIKLVVHCTSICFTGGGRIPGGEWSAHFFPVLFRGLCGRKSLPSSDSSVLIIPVLAKQKALCQKNSLAIWIFNNYSTSARWLWVGYN